jgi:hypothetical protein
MTHLLALIFLALCAIAILLATPQEDRGTALTVIVGTLVTLLVLSWLWPFVVLAGYWVWTTLTPWGVLSVGICLVFLLSWYFDRRENRKIRNGDPAAIERRVSTLMKNPRYTRDKAGEAVNRLRAANPALNRQLTTEEQDPMTADGGIMFRGKQLSREEYMALPASEKACWQDETNRLLDTK